MSNILKKIEKKSKNKRIELNDGQYRIKDKRILNIFKSIHKRLVHTNQIIESIEMVKNIIDTQTFDSDGVWPIMIELKKDADLQGTFTDYGVVDAENWDADKISKEGREIDPSTIINLDTNNISNNAKNEVRLAKPNGLFGDEFYLYKYLSKYFDVAEMEFGVRCIDLKTEHITLYQIEQEVA